MTYGKFGRTYIKPTTAVDKGTSRKEIYITTVVDGQTITTILRDTIVPDDPYMNLAKAAAYARMTNTVFPAPRIPRSVKDPMIRAYITI